MLSLDVEATKRLQAIQKSFDQGTRFPQIGVRLSEIEFPAEELPGAQARKEWERVGNMYNYARKQNDLNNQNRILLIIAELKDLCARYHTSPSLRR